MTELVFLGDVYLPRPYACDLHLAGHYIINLESPITSAMHGYPDKVNLKCEANYLESVFGKKPIAVCLANNHIMDYGEEGYRDTVRILDESGIGYFGAGYLDSNCNNPLVLQIAESSIALIGYVCRSTSPVFATDAQPGVMPSDLDQIVHDIERAKAAAVDRIVVSLHWGAEEVYLPKPADVEMAHRLLDAGAHMIIGHHAHCVQPCEIYKSKYIFYGLGNCIMPSLDVPRDYVDGMPSGRFKKKGHRWNRVGLAVRYEVETNHISVTGTAFDDVRLSACTKSRLKKRPLQRWRWGYRKAFSLSYFHGKIRPLVANYLHNPKLPRLSHLRFIYQLLKSLALARVYK